MLLQIYLRNCEAKKSFYFQGVCNSALIVVLEYRNVHLGNKDKSGYGFPIEDAQLDGRITFGMQKFTSCIWAILMNRYRDLVFVKIIGEWKGQKPEE